MKKQVLALSCALALGSGAALSPATGPAAEPTAQIAYGVVKYLEATGPGKSGIEGALTAAGGGIGQTLGMAQFTVTTIRGMSARTMVSIGVRFGARVGMFGGFAGLVIGGAVGAL